MTIASQQYSLLKELPIKRMAPMDSMTLLKLAKRGRQFQFEQTRRPALSHSCEVSHTTAAWNSPVDAWTRPFLLPKKRVRFAETATVSLRPVSQEDLGKMWYRHSEYASFDHERRRTISAINEVQGDLMALDPKEFCVRGLEQQLCPKQVLARKMKTMQYKRVVLEHYHMQKQLGISNPDTLQAVSEMFSKQASKRAHLRGIIDHDLSL